MEAKKDLMSFKHQLKIKTNQLKDHTFCASNKRCLEEQVLTDIKASLSADTAADLEAFTSNLKASMEASKDHAHKQADCGVRDSQWVTSGSHRCTRSTHPTPHHGVVALPHKIVPSSQHSAPMPSAPLTPSTAHQPLNISVPILASLHKRH